MIKKYRNRRLYDTAESRYVTGAEVAVMFKVGSVSNVLTMTGDDVTAEVCVSIVADLVKAGRITATELLPLILAVTPDPRWTRRASA